MVMFPCMFAALALTDALSPDYEANRSPQQEKARSRTRLLIVTSGADEVYIHLSAILKANNPIKEPPGRPSIWAQAHRQATQRVRYVDRISYNRHPRTIDWLLAFTQVIVVILLVKAQIFDNFYIRLVIFVALTIPCLLLLRLVLRAPNSVFLPLRLLSAVMLYIRALLKGISGRLIDRKLRSWSWERARALAFGFVDAAYSMQDIRLSQRPLDISDHHEFLPLPYSELKSAVQHRDQLIGGQAAKLIHTLLKDPSIENLGSELGAWIWVAYFTPAIFIQNSAGMD